MNTNLKRFRFFVRYKCTTDWWQDTKADREAYLRKNAALEICKPDMESVLYNLKRMPNLSLSLFLSEFYFGKMDRRWIRDALFTSGNT